MPGQRLRISDLQALHAEQHRRRIDEHDARGFLMISDPVVRPRIELGSVLNRLVPAINGCYRGPARLFPGVDAALAPLPPLARTEEERGRTSGSGLSGAAVPSYSEAEAMSYKIREQFEQS